MKGKKFFLLSLLALFLIVLNADPASASSPWDKKDVDPFHDFKVKFNQDIDVNTLNHISVVDSANVKVNVNVKFVNALNTIMIEAPATGYKPGETYFIFLSKQLKSVKGKTLKEPLFIKFTIYKSSDVEINGKFQRVSTDEKKIYIVNKETNNVEELNLETETRYFISSNQSLIKLSKRDFLDTLLVADEADVSYKFKNGIASYVITQAKVASTTN
ncbi:Ig-like domain-containing protein [Metabacillus fastidiosus]|uniref:Ig-like domain-containing protein n=1 Tax=Metabacillus fastidiosus TaxID=1458 RepID=UPI002E239EE2|nr:hypothetical protein [Metabacillus fastidiosus]